MLSVLIEEAVRAFNYSINHILRIADVSSSSDCKLLNLNDCTRI